MNKRYTQFNPYNNLTTPKTLAAQEAFAREVSKFCNTEPEEAHGLGNHKHKCLFSMLSNNKSLQLSQCKEWRKNHNITAPFDKMEWSDACDYCEMMCYLALDDEGKLMWAISN